MFCFNSTVKVKDIYKERGEYPTLIVPRHSLIPKLLELNVAFYPLASCLAQIIGYEKSLIFGEVYRAS